ncbi:MAG: putative sugar nucleotidyl transferase [Thaumarchaeota archaeon]|nr:putative sugar nucleotidyl transferase [Candidatus Calditenuaceae archaeon]MDW8041546.1 putative sugar nucleotidyl transferase [Nitrososphaerota archaeon]
MTTFDGQLVIVEPDTEPFEPLTLTRSFCELVLGSMSVLERYRRTWLRGNGPVVVLTGTHLAGVLRERLLDCKINEPDAITSDEVLVVNPVFPPVSEVLRSLESLRDKRGAIVSGGQVVGVHLKREDLLESIRSQPYFPLSMKHLLGRINEVKEVRGLKRVAGFWDLVSVSLELLESDLSSVEAREWEGDVLGDVAVLGDRAKVILGKGALVEPHVTFDVRKGPVIVEDDVVVMSCSRLQGPCLIERSSIVFPNSFVSTSFIGESCRIGGEVERSVFLGFSNKRHYGYAGHAYVGEWVNLGAGTTLSNLKNTYGTVRVRTKSGTLDTGHVFLGPVLGDHVKASIGTSVFSGKRVGAFSHLYGTVTDDVPAFTIYAKGLRKELIGLRLESAIETARRMMSRRGKELTPAYERMIGEAFSITSTDRSSAGVKSGEFYL